MSTQPEAAPARKKSPSTQVLCWMTKRFYRVFLVFGVALFAGGELFRLVEPEKFAGYDGFGGFVRAFYWAVTTGLSVGFGDIAPSTVPGMLVFIFFAPTWVCLFMSAIIVTILRKIVPDPHQFTHGEQEWIIYVLLLIARHLKLEVPDPPSDTDDGDVDDPDMENTTPRTSATG